MAPTLGRCGLCANQFTTASHAYKCVVCKVNYHPQCLQLDQGYAALNDGIIFSALRETNCIVCKACRETPVADPNKRPRGNSADLVDQEQIVKLTEQVKKLTEERRIMEERIRGPSTARKLAEETEQKLKAANLKIAQLESSAFSSTNQNLHDKAALEKVSLVEKEIATLKAQHLGSQQKYEKDIAELRAKNSQLIQDYASAAEKYSSLKRQKRTEAQAMQSQPSTSTGQTGEQPIIITTANMEELLLAPLMKMMTEIRHEVRDARRAQRHVSITPPNPSQKATYAQVANTQPSPVAVLRGRSISRRRSQSQQNRANSSFIPVGGNRRRVNQVSKAPAAKAQPLKKAVPGITMAAALALQPMRLQNRFTILLDEAATEEDPHSVFAKMQADSELATIADIATLEKRAGLSLYVEATTEDGAAALKAEIARKYPAAMIREPAPRLPLIRITGCPIIDYDENTIMRQNPWLVGPIKIERMYDAGTGPKMYRNIIVSLTLDDQAAAIENGRMTLGFTICRVHEYVDTMQCRKCWRYGHFRHACRYAQICRICGKGDHTDETCNAPRDSCANCVRHNKTSTTKVATNHRITDDRCPVRISRNEYVKDFLISKHPRRGGRGAAPIPIPADSNMVTN